MLITREPGPEKKIQFRIRMNESIYKEIAAYCHWAGISVKDYFIEQSCKFIFDNDSEWKMYKEQQKAEGKDIV